MGDSLLDALMRSYRNSGHLQFWEPHLDNILFCHLDVMNCSTTNLVWKSKTGITPADVYNFDPNPPKTRKSCKSDDKFSKGRQRNFSSHKRQLTLQDLYNCGYDVTNLDIAEASEPSKKPKRRMTPKSQHAPKRRKINEEDSPEMELDDKF